MTKFLASVSSSPILRARHGRTLQTMRSTWFASRCPVQGILFLLALLCLLGAAQPASRIAPGAEYKKYEVPTWRLLAIPEVRRAYSKALSGQAGIPSWVRRLEVAGTVGAGFTNGSEIVFVYHGNKIKEGHRNVTIAYEARAGIIGIRLAYYHLGTDQLESERLLGTPTPFMKQLMAVK